MGGVRAGRVATADHGAWFPTHLALKVDSVWLQGLPDVVIVGRHALHCHLSKVFVVAQELHDIILGLVKSKFCRLLVLVDDVFYDDFRAIVDAISMHTQYHRGVVNCLENASLELRQ